MCIRDRQGGVYALLFKKLSIALIIVVTMLCQSVNVFAAEVILGGQSIGIELDYEGIMITGTYDISIDNKKYNPASDGYMSGDLITHVNNQKVNSISDLMEVVEKDLSLIHILYIMESHLLTIEKEF